MLTTLAAKAIMIAHGVASGWPVVADHASAVRNRSRKIAIVDQGKATFAATPDEPRHEERIRGRCRKSRQLAATETGEVQ